MENFDVGGRLKGLRIRFGLSQRQLADAADVPHGQISMIETNKSNPSVASLRKILGGLGIGMSEFFEPDESATGSPFFAPMQLRDMTSKLYSEHSEVGGKITLLQVGDARANNLQILHETFETGTDTGKDMLEHASNEGGVVISGEIEITVGEIVQVLKAGDAYLFDLREPHRFRNVSDRNAIVVSACTPPTCDTSRRCLIEVSCAKLQFAYGRLLLIEARERTMRKVANKLGKKLVNSD